MWCCNIYRNMYIGKIFKEPCWKIITFTQHGGLPEHCLVCSSDCNPTWERVAVFLNQSTCRSSWRGFRRSLLRREKVANREGVVISVEDILGPRKVISALSVFNSTMTQCSKSLHLLEIQKAKRSLWLPFWGPSGGREIKVNDFFRTVRKTCPLQVASQGRARQKDANFTP